MSNKDFPVPSISNEETVVGVHSSGIQLEEGANTSNSRYYCSNCRKKIHCYVKVNRDTKEAKVHVTCKDKLCECKCKTHYSCKSCGYLHPYGQKCDREDTLPTPTPEQDKNWQKLLASFNKEDEKK